MKLIIQLRAAIVAILMVALAVVSPTTATAATRSCSSSTAISLRPTLAYGDTGSCVVVAQKLLLAKGYSLGGYSATGNYLKFTTAAVKRFQANNKLSQTGKLDQATWKKLATVVKPKPAPKPGTYNTSRGPNYTSRVVLTFDDCPNSLSAMKAVVLYAQSQNIGLVLAPTGECLQSGRFDAAFARAHGQYVINHSVSHADLTRLSYAGVLKQLGAPGVVTNSGRPPYGATNTTVRSAYAAKGMRMWTWGVDTNDWQGKSASSVINYVVRYSFAGSTDLMHMQWSAFNASAIGGMNSGLAKRGLNVCRAYPGKTPVYMPSSLPC